MSAAERNIRATYAILNASGCRDISPSKASRLVRRYERVVAPNGLSLFDYIASEIDLDEWQRAAVLRDPEVARVLRGRRS